MKELKSYLGGWKMGETDVKVKNLEIKKRQSWLLKTLE